MSYHNFKCLQKKPDFFFNRQINQYVLTIDEEIENKKKEIAKKNIFKVQ